MWGIFKSYFHKLARLTTLDDRALIVVANAPFAPDTELTTIAISDLRTVIGTAGGSTTQFVRYTTGTPANPTNLNSPAIAYDPNKVLDTFIWDIPTQTWV